MRRCLAARCELGATGDALARRPLVPRERAEWSGRVRSAQLRVAGRARVLGHRAATRSLGEKSTLRPVHVRVPRGPDAMPERAVRICPRIAAARRSDPRARRAQHPPSSRRIVTARTA
jgi:hypothetical protein